MELYEFYKKFTELVGTSDLQEIPKALEKHIETNNESFFKSLKTVHDDLTTDHLQPIFQYYMADRKEKMQDYTPSCLGKLVAKLNHLENAKSCYDMCAGSGSLTIQAWNLNPECTFICEELDPRVIPFLLCNLIIRNIQGLVIHGDILSKERFKAWRLCKGHEFSTVLEIDAPLEIKADCCISNPPYNIKWDSPVFAQLDKRFINYGIPPRNNANFAFVLNALSIAESSALILPCNVLESKDQHEIEIKEQLIKQNNIDAIVVNPDKMFEATGIATCILTVRKTRATTAVEMIYCFNKNYTQVERKQRGQFGGASHENRVFTKILNEYTDENIDKIVCLADSKAVEPELANAVFPDDIKIREYRLSPSIYIDFKYEQPKHREYADIMDDINRVRKRKNACKLIINETIARQMGIDTKTFGADCESMGETDSLMQQICGKSFEKPDYITFSKNKNEFILKANSKEEFPEMLSLAFGMWKQRIMLFNNEENVLLAELRDALLPDLMSGKIEI